MPKSNTSSSSIPQFRPGDRVEISSDDHGFRGSWFTGTVIRREKKNPNRYVVEYDKLFEDESGDKLLQETVYWVQLRPPPPPEQKNVKLKFGDEVEAFHSDGWWEGAITEEHADGKFAVFFRSSKEQIVFEEKDLRLRMEWVEGRWEPPFEQRQREKERSQKKTDSRPSKVAKRESSSVIHGATSPGNNSEKIGKGKKFSEPKANPNHPEETMRFTQGMEVEVQSDDEGFKGAWFAATIIEPSGGDKYLIEYKTLTNDDDTEFLREDIRACHVRPCPPETILVDGFKVMDEVDAYYNEGWWVGLIAKVMVNCKYMVYFKDTDEKIAFKQADLRPHQDWLNGKWVVPSKALKQ